MSSQETLNLGCITNREVIERLVNLEGCHLLDVGCGDMGFTQQLAEMSGQVLAIDPDPIQAAKNRERDPLPHITFQQAEAGFDTGRRRIHGRDLFCLFPTPYTGFILSPGFSGSDAFAETSRISLCD